MRRLDPARSIPVVAVALCVTMLVAAAPASAQVITGRVEEESTARPLAETEVRLETPDGRRVARTVADSAGMFRLQAPRFGSFVLVAAMIGMTSVTTAPFSIDEGTTEVVLRMAATAVPLEPLTVEARGGAAELGPLAGYFERMRWNERAGIGRFLTRDQIDARNPSYMSDMLREIPRISVQRGRGTSAHVTMRGGRGECIPALYIDGTRANRRDRAYVDELVRPNDVEGVEVYIGAAQLPGAYYDETGCGVLLVWTRRSPEDGRPFTWRRALVGLGLASIIFFLAR